MFSRPYSSPFRLLLFGPPKCSENCSEQQKFSTPKLCNIFCSCFILIPRLSILLRQLLVRPVFVQPLFVQRVLGQSFSSNPVFVQSCFHPFGFRPWPIFVQTVFVQTVSWSKTNNFLIKKKDYFFKSGQIYMKDLESAA